MRFLSFRQIMNIEYHDFSNDEKVHFLKNLADEGNAVLQQA
jgi:hypothetical protein